MRIITVIRTRIQDIRENKARRDASHREATERAHGYIMYRLNPGELTSR